MAASGRKPTSTTRHGNGAGSGPGWGGPAKGAGRAGPDGSRPDFEPANLLGAGRGNESAAGIDKRARDDERRERLKDKLDDLAMNAESETVQMQASVALLNRIDGMPVATNLNVNRDDLDDLTDEQLRERLADLRRRGSEIMAAGDKPPLPN